MTSRRGGSPQEIHLGPLSLSRFRELLDQEGWMEMERAIERAQTLLEGRVVWNVNSTAVGGGVAEMLQSLVAYARGAGVDARWVVIAGSAEFFRLTKRLHNLLHGDPGDGGQVGQEQHSIYESTLRRNAEELAASVRTGDVVILHDPQTAGLVRPLKETGALVVWRSHVGAEEVNEHVERGWDFLMPYVKPADAYVFSRYGYVPSDIKGDRAEVIPPSIDAFSPKNQEMAPEVVRDILSHVGLVAGSSVSDGRRTFHRQDGTPGRVDRRCDVLGTGSPPDVEEPLVVQVSRWDRLKDPMGVIRGFIEHVAPLFDAHLIVAGPTVHSVADDPEGQQVLDETEAFWRTLPHAPRSRVHLVCLPMSDVEENAAIVNALQRHAKVVVQKSLQEGFGLTVTEAMWKARPVVASGIGGVREQIEDGVSGLLLSDPRDLDRFGQLLRRVLTDTELAGRLGQQARLRVRGHFLANRHLTQYVTLLERLIA